MNKINISELKEYRNNNKKHPVKQIKLVANSIKEFGFIQPIVIDKNKDIVIGHCRYLAAKLLKMEEVPYISVENLTDAQVKALRLADNKLSMFGKLDIDNINLELGDLKKLNFDISITGFELKEDEEEIEKENPLSFENLEIFHSKVTSKFDLPIILNSDIEKYLDLPPLTFNEAKNSTDYNSIVNFFIDDYHFKILWSNPEKYIEKLKRFSLVCSPEFSMYTDFPYPILLMNTYKNRWIGAFLQSQGVRIVPTLCWGNKESWNYCFEGVEKNGIYAISTNGMIKNITNDEKQLFVNGFEKMIELLNPAKVLVFGGKMKELEKWNDIIIWKGGVRKWVKQKST